MIPARTLVSLLSAHERKHPSATGELSELILSIALGIKFISHLVATSGLNGLARSTGRINVQGEETRELDEAADSILCDVLGSSGHFGLLVSEERERVVATDTGKERGKYVVAFDPLDGSSNLGSNIPVGTIFAIFRKRDPNKAPTHEDFYQSGEHIVAAGYAVYGAKTTFVYSAGDGVYDFTLDPTVGEFLLVDDKMKIPYRGGIYSVNEGNAGLFDPPVRKFIDQMKEPNADLKTPYSARYVGSLVADFDRTLRKGGIFLYPGTTPYPKGKLRLLYEVMPLAWVMEQAGGLAVSGKDRALELIPTGIHDRAPFVVGSPFEVNWYLEQVEQVTDTKRR